MRRFTNGSPLLLRKIRLSRPHRFGTTKKPSARNSPRPDLFQSANDPMLVMDPLGHYLEANEAACRHFGYTREELLSMTAPQLAGMTEKEWQEIVALTLQTGSRIVEVEHHRRDGTVVPVEVSARVITYAGQTAFLTVVRNMARRKEVEAELARRNLELASLVAATARRVEQLAATERVAGAVSALQPFDELFPVFVEQARRLVSFDSIIFALFNPETQQFVAHLKQEEDDAPACPAEDWPSDPALHQLLLRSETAFSPDGASAWDAGDKVDAARALAVPLISRGRLQGALLLGRRAGGPAFTPADDDAFAPVAAQFATAIGNGRLLEEMQALAIREERSRLGREMHDRVGQALASASIYSAAAAEMLRGGHVSEANWAVGEISKALQQAYADLRDAIQALRCPNETHVEWAEGLRRYVARYEKEFGIGCNFSLDAAVPPACDALCRLELMRIVQEALTNVRKHAQATHVSVAIQLVGGSVHAEVTDNGHGFDPAIQTPGHYGLDIMRERAHRLGGEVFIESGASGTRLCVRMPARKAAKGSS